MGDLVISFYIFSWQLSKAKFLELRSCWLVHGRKKQHTKCWDSFSVTPTLTSAVAEGCLDQYAFTDTNMLLLTPTCIWWYQYAFTDTDVNVVICERMTPCPLSPYYFVTLSKRQHIRLSIAFFDLSLKKFLPHKTSIVYKC